MEYGFCLPFSWKPRTRLFSHSQCGDTPGSSVVRTLRCKRPGCGLESGPYICLLGVSREPLLGYLSQVWHSAVAKQTNQRTNSPHLSHGTVMETERGS